MRAVVAPADLPAAKPMTGVGNAHLTVMATPEAQVWFTQGLNLFHDFWDYESAKSFEQAIRVDPNCAMCYWGLYEAQTFRGGWDAYSAAALEQAKRLKKKATPKEQLYIEAAVADRENREGAKDEKDEKAIRLMRKAVAMDPTDLQAKIFLAGYLDDGYDDGEPKEGTRQAITVLEEALKAVPDDSAANHYWIHAMEPTNHPERAIRSAQELASLAPSSGHMVHMPGHIFYRTGDYASAEKWFAASTAVDEGYLQAEHVDVDDDWNYVHNLMYRIANLMEEGKFAEAEVVSQRLVAARGRTMATLYVWAPNDSMTRLSLTLPVAMRQGDWTAVQTMLDKASPDAKLVNLNFLAGELKVFASGMQALKNGNVAAAEVASKKLEADVVAKTPPPAAKVKREKHPKGPVQEPLDPDAMMPSLVSSLKIMSQELQAGVALQKKDVAGAKKLFDAAAEAETKLGYHEPPSLIQPVTEAEGLLLLRAGDVAASHAAYAKALKERPNSGFELYGEAQASEAVGNSKLALDEYALFLDAWKDADAGLPEVKHAREYVAAHPVLASR
ncbi:MAG: hypothetical protein PW792_15250 [Acidobacteriaceae bacterium]|nr:hypothetical protein [Acidobacteriaceae bacterium]